MHSALRRYSLFPSFAGPQWSQPQIVRVVQHHISSPRVCSEQVVASTVKCHSDIAGEVVDNPDREQCQHYAQHCNCEANDR